MFQRWRNIDSLAEGLAGNGHSVDAVCVQGFWSGVRNILDYSHRTHLHTLQLHSRKLTQLLSYLRSKQTSDCDRARQIDKAVILLNLR